VPDLPSSAGHAIDLDHLAAPILHFDVGEVDASLVGHLQEKQVRQLLDVVAVVDAVMTERVAEPPKFGNDISH
jgi:uncharacterized pyridoxal phosphate-containing UPF0001 family protein